jgi:hypothetical protein
MTTSASETLEHPATSERGEVDGEGEEEGEEATRTLEMYWRAMWAAV